MLYYFIRLSFMKYPNIFITRMQELPPAHKLPFVQANRHQQRYTRRSNLSKSEATTKRAHTQKIRANHLKFCHDAQGCFKSTRDDQGEHSAEGLTRVRTDAITHGVMKIVVTEARSPGSARKQDLQKCYTQPSEGGSGYYKYKSTAMPPQKLSARFREMPYKHKGYFQVVRQDLILKSILNSRTSQVSMNINVQQMKLSVKNKQPSPLKQVVSPSSAKQRAFAGSTSLKEVPDQELQSMNSIKQRKVMNLKPVLNRSVDFRLNTKQGCNASLLRIRKFQPPFETYYYRDMIWKVNYSNQVLIYPPLEYEHRLRVYVGRGNNSGLIKGLIKRRLWLAITDRIEQANILWTQIKVLSYFNQQSSRQIDDQTRDDQVKGTGLLTACQEKEWRKYLAMHSRSQERTDERLQHRSKHFSKKSQKKLPCQNQQEQYAEWGKNARIPTFTKIIKQVAEIRQQRMQNHLINNYVIGNKKALFKIMSLYYKKIDDYVFNYLPLTFHIEKGLDDENYFKFLRHYKQRSKQTEGRSNVWIIKPGEYSNRGNGITVCHDLDEIKKIIKSKQRYPDGTFKTFIVQAYIDKPLLYCKRKFDLRHYMMITCVNGILKGYWYQEGYVRTSSTEFSLDIKDGSVHLTNDAIQKNLPDYGKYQKGNKISYEELDSYLLRVHGFKNFKFKEIILPKMKKITTDIFRACSGSIDPQFRQNNFEIFGMDFMIDFDFNVWLIEVNSNPCLQLSCPLLARIIPTMVENAFELTIDAAFPPPTRFLPKGVHYAKELEKENKFDLVYDSRLDGINRDSQQVIDAALLNDQEEEYEDDGEEWSEKD